MSRFLFALLLCFVCSHLCAFGLEHGGASPFGDHSISSSSASHVLLKEKGDYDCGKFSSCHKCLIHHNKGCIWCVNSTASTWSGTSHRGNGTEDVPQGFCFNNDTKAGQALCHSSQDAPISKYEHCTKHRALPLLGMILIILGVSSFFGVFFGCLGYELIVVPLLCSSKSAAVDEETLTMSINEGGGPIYSEIGSGVIEISSDGEETGVEEITEQSE